MRAFEAALRGVCETQLPEYDMEILFVDDGSTDATLSIVKELAEKSNDIRYLSFSRNFGKEAAIYAGLQYATGDLVAIMDADLQDPPTLLPKLVEAVTRRDGASCDIARVRRVDRSKEPLIRSVCARTFYRVINSISDTKIVDGARDYQVMKRCVVEAILSMGEYNRFLRVSPVGWDLTPNGSNTKTRSASEAAALGVLWVWSAMRWKVSRLSPRRHCSWLRGLALSVFSLPWCSFFSSWCEPCCSGILFPAGLHWCALFS